VDLLKQFTELILGDLMGDTAKSGDTVSVHYTGKLEGGDVFDSSEGRGPLQFTIGAGQVLKHFENGVTGMTEGEEKEVVVPAGEGYDTGELAGKKLIFKVTLVKIEN